MTDSCGMCGRTEDDLHTGHRFVAFGEGPYCEQCGFPKDGHRHEAGSEQGFKWHIGGADDGDEVPGQRVWCGVCDREKQRHGDADHPFRPWTEHERVLHGLFQGEKERAKHETAPWQVEGLWRRGSLVMIYGRTGRKKSFAVVDIANRVSLGLPIDARQVWAASSYYAVAERIETFPLRQRAWEIAHGGGEPTERLYPHFGAVDLVGRVDPYGRERNSILTVDKLAEQIEWGNAGAEVPFGLAVFDSLDPCMPGHSDVDPVAMGKVRDGLDIIRAQGIACVVVVNTGLDESHPRGSTVIRDAADLVFRVDETKDGDVRLRTDVGTNDLPEGLSIVLRPREIEVPAWGTEEGGQTLVLDPLPAGRDDQIIEALADVESASFPELREATELPKSTLSRRLGALVEEGRIVRDEADPPRWRLR